MSHKKIDNDDHDVFNATDNVTLTGHIKLLICNDIEITIDGAIIEEVQGRCDSVWFTYPGVDIPGNVTIKGDMGCDFEHDGDIYLPKNIVSTGKIERRIKARYVYVNDCYIENEELVSIPMGLNERIIVDGRFIICMGNYRHWRQLPIVNSPIHVDRETQFHPKQDKKYDCIADTRYKDDFVLRDVSDNDVIIAKNILGSNKSCYVINCKIKKLEVIGFSHIYIYGSEIDEVCTDDSMLSYHNDSYYPTYIHARYLISFSGSGYRRPLINDNCLVYNLKILGPGTYDISGLNINYLILDKDVKIIKDEHTTIKFVISYDYFDHDNLITHGPYKGKGINLLYSNNDINVSSKHVGFNTSRNFTMGDNLCLDYNYPIKHNKGYIYDSDTVSINSLSDLEIVNCKKVTLYYPGFKLKSNNVKYLKLNCDNNFIITDLQISGSWTLRGKMQVLVEDIEKVTDINKFIIDYNIFRNRKKSSKK